MTGSRVVLVTITGPGGQVDAGVRADATPVQLAGALGRVIGLGPGWPAAEHRSPPRPGIPQGRRAVLAPDVSLAAAGVVDGDLLIFAAADKYAADGYAAGNSAAGKYARPRSTSRDEE